MQFSAGAGWHLLSGDDRALPAISALIEAMTGASHALALLEVGSAADKLPLESAARLEVDWQIGRAHV